MKTNLLLGILLVFFTPDYPICAVENVFSVKQDFRKDYHHEFKVTPGSILDISNKFGKVHIQNWDKQEVSIDVTIKVEENDKDDAEEIFRKIKINFKEEGNLLKAWTELDDNFHDSHFSIDYQINMPENLHLKLANKYGDVFISKLTGLTEIMVKYGSFKAQKLLNGKEKPRSELTLEYCKESRIDECNWLKISLGYSKLTVENGKALMVQSKYSRLNVENANSIVAESKYDEYRIGTLNKIVNNGQYSNYDIKNVNAIIELETKYSDVDIDNVSADFEDIKIVNKYGKVKLGISPDASYKLNANLEYCKISYPESRNVRSSKEITKESVSGTIGKDSNPNSRVEITSKYGDVHLER